MTKRNDEADEECGNDRHDSSATVYRYAAINVDLLRVKTWATMRLRVVSSNSSWVASRSCRPER